MAEITLDKKTFEALAIDSRVKIMKSLKQRRKTQSELAKELGIAASTVSEHLDKMGDAGLIIRKNQGKKWVYYELTEKGATIVSPVKTSVFVFALSVSLILMFSGLFLAYSSFQPMASFAAAPITGGAQKTLSDATTTGAATTGTDSEQLSVTATSYVRHEYLDAEKLGVILGVAGIIMLMMAFRYKQRTV